MNNYDYLEKLNIGQIEAYLSLNGWVERKSVKLNLPYKNYYLNDIFNQVLVPKEKNVLDNSYLIMIEDLLINIARYEKKEKNLIIQEIFDIDKNIIYIKYIDDSRNDFNIPANVMKELLDNSKKMFTSSYADINVENKKEYRKGRFSKEVLEIEEKIEFGQTLKGSYIIPMLIPSDLKLEKKFYPADIFGEETLDVIENKVDDDIEKAINKLISSVEKIKTTIDEGENLDLLIDTKSLDFTSVDFLNALSSLGKSSDKNTIIEFSSSISLNSNEKISTSISRNYTAKVQKYVEDYKNKYSKDNKFVGRFTKLEVDPVLDDREIINVEIVGFAHESDDSSNQRILCQFNYAKFAEKIFEAMEKGSTVFVEGTREQNKLINAKFEILKM